MSESMEQLEKDVILNSEPADAGSAVVESEENVKSGNKYAGLDKDGIINALEEALQKPVEEIKDDVTAMKAAFSLIRKGEIEKEKAEFLEKGNEESAL